MSTLWLLLKNLFFTLTVPVLVIGWVPLRVFERRAQWPDIHGARHLVAVGLFVTGVVAFLHCQWLFYSRGQGTPAPVDPPKKFVRRGLYKWVRNPMYLAVLGMVGAEALYFRSTDILIYLICLACVLHLFVLLYEENALRQKFGAMYEDYRGVVNRWLPRRPKPALQTVAPFEVRGDKR